jgi:dihydroceramidase
MTGLGAYCYIVWSSWLRHCLNERQDEYDLAWPKVYRLPEVVRLKGGNVSNGHLGNGSAKKSQ